MKYSLIILCLASIALASPTLDDLYSLKTFNVGVINPELQPLYAETIRDSMYQMLKGQQRAEFNETAFLVLKKKLDETKFAPVQEIKPEKLAQFNNIIQDQYGQGVRALILAEVIPTEDNYYVSLMLFATKNAELLYSSKMPVDNRFLLDSFSSATRSAMTDMLKQIPFDGAVLSREGYRVVIDRGKPYLKPGMQFPVYTIQLDGPTKVLEETGTVILTQVDDSIAFGRILVERKPLEVTTGNKIRLSNDLPAQWKLGGDLLVSENGGSAPFPLKKRYGFLDVQLSGLMMNLSNSTNAGAGLTSQNNFYPGGTFRGEVWITNSIFFDFAFNFASTSMLMDFGGGLSYNLNSSLSNLRTQLGYRIFITPSEYGTSVHFKIGFARNQFAIDVTPDPLTFSNSTTSGLVVSAGAKFPITDRLGFGFEINTMLFPSLEETPYRSGDTYSNLTVWDAALKTYYALSPTLEVSARAYFDSMSCNFTGAGTRPIPLANMSQIGRAITLGISYYF